MPELSLKEFLQICQNLLNTDQAREAAALAKQIADPKAVARELVKRGRLTTHQANLIFSGRAGELILGNYVLMEVLGQGGMGQVLKARHKVMDRIVAVKVIRVDRLKDADSVARFVREIKAVAKLSHPHVVRAYDAETSGSTHYCVMEFVEGTDLARWLKERGPLPVAEACTYIRQAALGLQHAHQHDLVHRDIKPANLMRSMGKGDEAPTIKLLDLGLARLRSELMTGQTVSELTKSDSIMGTPDYLAPEQAANPGAVDIRADIYSLGCTLYHLLTGQVPFPGGTLAQKLQWHREAQPAAVQSVRRDLPTGLGEIVHKMMAKRPADRFATPAEVAAALLPFCGPQREPDTVPVLLSPPETASMSTQRTANTSSGGSSRWLISVLVVALLLAIGTIGVFTGKYLLNKGSNGGENGDPKTPPDNPERIVIELAGIAKPDEAKRIVFLLDNQPITFEALGKEIPLTIGRHELVVQQNGVVVERRDFIVVKEMAKQKFVIPEEFRNPGKITSLPGHQGEVTSVAFSGDGLRLLSVGPFGLDGIFVWSMPDGKELHHFKRGKPPPLIKSFSWCGALSPDGHAALIGCHHFYKQVVNKPWLHALGLESGTRLWETNQHTKSINSVQYSSSGKLALSADDAGLTKIWDAATGQMLHQLPGSRACFSPMADRVLTATKTEAALWQLSTPPKELMTFKGHSNPISGLAFAPGGRHVLTCGDGTARLWDITTGKEVQIFKGHETEVTSVAISPDGLRVLTGSKDTTVRLWDVLTGKEIYRFTGHTDMVHSVAYSPGGRRAASGGADHAVLIWALPK